MPRMAAERRNEMFGMLTTAAIAFVLAAMNGIFMIPMLHKLKFGQEIREEGPGWHKAKSGTPTMGGFIFIPAVIVAAVFGMLVFHADKREMLGTAMLLLAAVGFGVIGFIDDYIKVIMKRNLGLRAAQKFGLQFLVAVLFSVLMVSCGIVKPEIIIPFTGKMLKLGVFAYIPFIVVVMLATVNSVNLTDGIDGLAGTVTLVVGIFYCIMSEVHAALPVKLLAASLCGALLGFLIYNSHPARVFMGDTGSLFLGGAVAAAAIYMQNPVALLIVGFVYVAEALSVIIQVAYFKKTGKRIFKMSPIHHHFEMCGWSEVKIVTVFSLVTAVLCAIGFWA